MKYCHEIGKWFTWDGTKWAVDNGKILGLAINTVKRIYTEADESDQKLRTHALKSENVARIRGLITLAQAKCQKIELDQFDIDKMVLNVGNGILDLTDGTLHPHDPDKNHSKIAGANYDKNATCPVWLAFLDKIFAGNAELIGFIQRTIGYSLTADVTEEIFLILWGNGNNGKSTLTDTIGAVLGDYTRVAAPDIFMRNKVNQHPTEIADLKGARFVSSEESDKNIRLNEGRVKMMVGTRKIKARMMRQDFFEFEQEYKLWFATNHKPVITGTDNGIWRRIQLVPFKVKIPEHEVDKHLLKKLDKELSGILKWAVEGCLAWQRDGIQIPDIVKAATEEYRLESDILGSFIDDCCVLGLNIRVKAGELYSKYETWCDENGENSISNREFGKQIKIRGFDTKKSNGIRCYIGISLGMIFDDTHDPDDPHDSDDHHTLPDYVIDELQHDPHVTAQFNGLEGHQGHEGHQKPISENLKKTPDEPTPITDFVMIGNSGDNEIDELIPDTDPSAKVMAELVSTYSNERFLTCDNLREFFDEQEIKKFVELKLLKVCDNEDYLELSI